MKPLHVHENCEDFLAEVPNPGIAGAVEQSGRNMATQNKVLKIREAVPRHRPLIIGQAPGKDTKSEFPMYPLPKGRADDRLMKLMGISMREYLCLFDWMNIVEHFPGAREDGDKFPMSVAKVAAGALRPLLAGREVLMVGRGVASAFGLKDQEFLEWVDMPCRRRCTVSKAPWQARVLVVPHPSGRSRWYNTEDNRARASEFLQAWVGEHLLRP